MQPPAQAANRLLENLARFPLLNALRDRRSRRFGMGMKLPAGPLAFTSRHTPVPLSEEEEATLVFAASGITGHALADLCYAPGGGGSIMAGLVARTIASDDGLQTVALIVINDHLYLHWFDHLFERADGPARWAKAKLVRYADDFVVLARYISPRLRGWIESKLEGWLELRINREKTRVLNVQRPGQNLDFLGYTFRYELDRYGRRQRYWKLQPSSKARLREREAVRQLINPKQSHTPLPELIGRLNRHLRGWANYFGLGYPREAFRELNHYVRCRLGQHLCRRSQRGWRARPGLSLYTHLQHLELVAL